MKKMNNKGFSLVELIIVIAIMAILIAVLAPQFLKYVERSRNSTDISTATEIVTALQTAQADPEFANSLAKDATFSVQIKAQGTTSTASAGFATEALKEAAITVADLNCKSKTQWTAYEIAGKGKADGSIEFEYKQTGGATNAFKNAMAGKSLSANK